MKCNGVDCELDGELVPNVGDIDLTVNGKLTSNYPCPNCGGTFESVDGVYIFKKGILQPQIES